MPLDVKSKPKKIQTMNLSPANERYFNSPSKKTILNSVKHLETGESPK